VPPSRDDKRLLIVTGAFVALAGLLFGAVLLLATNRSTGEKEPVFLGQRKELVERIEDGSSPLYFASPFGDQNGFWLDLEDGDLVAYVLDTPGADECTVKWRDRRDAYIDCTDTPVDPGDLDRYPLSVGSRDGSPGTSVYVDLRRTIPAPGAGGNTG
jgi:hypothetical protein